MDFEGFTPREIYWRFVASVILVLVIVENVEWISWINGGLFLLSIIPLLSATIRRIRDAGFNPWWGLLLAGPGTQVIVMIMAMFRTKDSTRYISQHVSPVAGSPSMRTNPKNSKFEKLKAEIDRMKQEHSSDDSRNSHNNEPNAAANYIEYLKEKLNTTTDVSYEEYKNQDDFVNADYEGDSLPDNRTTQGKYAFPDSMYEGELVDGEPTGKGKLIWTSGNVYEGSFRAGQLHGKGKIFYQEGDIFEGEFTNNNKTKGRYTYSDGNVYEGDFLDGKFHGVGFFEFAQGPVRTYLGDFVAGFFHGKGSMIFSDDAIYEGNFLHDKRSGKGKLTIPDGGTYLGDFVDNKFHGKGKQTFADGAVYEGDFAENKFHGQG